MRHRKHLNLFKPWAAVGNRFILFKFSNKTLCDTTYIHDKLIFYSYDIIIIYVLAANC